MCWTHSFDKLIVVAFKSISPLVRKWYLHINHSLQELYERLFLL
nr:MAG TPA: hypothetical protein [Caudoviricetes sp.]